MNYPEGTYFILLNPSKGISVVSLGERDYVEDNKVFRGVFLMGEIIDTCEGSIIEASNMAHEYRSLQKMLES